MTRRIGRKKVVQKSRRRLAIPDVLYDASGNLIIYPPLEHVTLVIGYPVTLHGVILYSIGWEWLGRSSEVLIADYGFLCDRSYVTRAEIYDHIISKTAESLARNLYYDFEPLVASSTSRTQWVSVKGILKRWKHSGAWRTRINQLIEEANLQKIILL